MLASMSSFSESLPLKSNPYTLWLKQNENLEKGLMHMLNKLLASSAGDIHQQIVPLLLPRIPA